MADYLDVERARARSGLRLVLTAGVPGPWGEAAKGLFHVKRIPYARVAQLGGEDNAEILAWTGESNAPQAVLDDERARTGWVEMIHLAERLAPDPPLLPRDPGERALLFGLGHLLCAEEGFGWQRRLMMLHTIQSIPFDVLPESNPARRLVSRLAGRYGYSAAAAEAAPGRCAQILELFAAHLEAQRRRGSDYFFGDEIGALDIYWAAFAAMLDPLPEDQCAMPPGLREQYQASNPVVRAASAPILLAHRDRVYERHLELPLDF